MKVNRSICSVPGGSVVYMGYPDDYKPQGEIRRDTVEVKAYGAPIEKKYCSFKEQFCQWDLDTITSCYRRSCNKNS